MSNTYTTVRWSVSGKWHRLAEVNGWVETTGCGKRVGERASYNTAEVNPWDVDSRLCPRCGFDF